MISPATYEPVRRALQALPRDASDGERAMAAIKALPDSIEPWTALILVGWAFVVGVVVGAYAVGARV